MPYSDKNTMIIAVFLISLTVKATFTVDLEWKNFISCPYGSTGENVTFCVLDAVYIEVCSKLLNCETCEDRVIAGSKCPTGFQGPFCLQEKKKSRQKRQNRRTYLPWRPLPRMAPLLSEERSCLNVESPKLGSIRCTSSTEEQTCTGQCLPGYRFTDGTLGEMNLTCKRGIWTPRAEFPDCISRGHCDLAVQGSGSFNCTTGMDGTRCDVRCYNRYVGQFFCYPGRAWEPTLPSCVRRKDMIEDRYVCECQNGGICDRDGNCVCPANRTGIYCETALSEKSICGDPGFISNGFRRNMDGSSANARQNFEEGQSVVYGCASVAYALRGSTLLTCRSDGTWSSSLPTCIMPATVAPVAPGIKYCQDPGVDSNGSRQPRIPPSRRGFPQGTRLEYSCNLNYDLSGERSLFCLTSGDWSANRPRCREKTDADRWYCIYPGGIENGIVVHIPSINERRRPFGRDDESEEQFPAGSRLQYSCDDGYNIEGPVTLTCEHTGKWSAEPPKCIKIIPDEMHYCDPPEPILNGRLQYFPPAVKQRSGDQLENVDYVMDEYPEGGVVEYFCYEGYRLQGEHSLTCLRTGSWSEKVPLCVSQCGLSFLEASNRVFMGERANSGEWPWVVSISAVSSNTSAFICGGAVLDTQTIITAGHCLVSGATDYILRFGKHHFKIQDDGIDVITRRSSRVIVHPGYIQTNTTLDNDIGLVMFQPRIEYSARVQPICLPTMQSTFRSIMTGRRGYVSGWGETENNAPPDVLMMTSLPVVNTETCIEVFKRQNVVVSRNMFCAGYEDSRQTVCSGDSGSPLVFYDSSSQRYTIEGLVSFGARGQCGSSGKYAIFTKVFRYVLWIYRHIQKIN